MVYWQDYPPTHVLVAAYLMGETKRSKSSTDGGGKINELTHAVGTVGGSSRGKLPQIYRS